MLKAFGVAVVMTMAVTLVACTSSKPDAAEKAAVSTGAHDNTRRAPTGRVRAGCPARPYPGKHTRFGINISTHGISFPDAVKQNGREFGQLPVLRFWDTHGPLNRVWDWQNEMPRGTKLVVSFRYSPQSVIAGKHDRQIHGFFHHTPRKRTIFWNYYHEPEAGVQNGEFTARQFRRAFRHIARIAARYCHRHLYPTLVLTGWTVDPRSHLDWKDYYPGGRYVSLVAWDPYNSATATPKHYARPADLFGNAVRASRSVHKPWGVAETGSGLVPGDDGTGRAGWLRDVARYTIRHHARFVIYFNSADGVDFRLTDATSRAAWIEQMNR